MGDSLHQRTETLVRDRERFEIERVRDRESQLYIDLIFLGSISDDNIDNSA